LPITTPSLLLLDNSAWSRLLSGSVPEDRAEMVIERLQKQQIATCLPFLLEAGYSARSAADRRTMIARLEQLPRVAIDSEVERRALEAQRELAEVGHHRLPPTDLVIAACAHQAGSGVLHYDRDYDLIAEHTELSFESIWLAEPGAL
jgi:predicted nucleic acid-binding protein